MFTATHVCFYLLPRQTLLSCAPRSIIESLGTYGSTTPDGGDEGNHIPVSQKLVKTAVRLVDNQDAYVIHRNAESIKQVGNP